MTIEYYFNSEIVEYYEPGNIEEMADAIVRLYSDPQRRALLALKGREFARVFAWEIFKQDLFSVIDGSRSSNHPSEERHKAIAC
jgi:glycosyltransferase involved in cell wall biosynthesis